MSLVDIRDLSVSFDGGEVVSGITLAVDAGEVVALVGESGSGKSVTARTLVGLAGGGSRVTADRLEVDGVDIRSAGSRALARIRGGVVGTVSQDALVSLDPLRTVGREVEDALRLHTDLSPVARRARVIELLAAAGIPDPASRASQRSDELSGGLRQRAVIAAALAGSPRVLVADEPTTALDRQVRDGVLDLVARQADAGLAVLLISHDLDAVRRVATRVFVMQLGRVVEHGPVLEVLRVPSHPYTKRLIAASPAGRPRFAPLSPAADVLPQTDHPSGWSGGAAAPSRRSSATPAPPRLSSAAASPSRRSSSDRAPGRGRVSRPAPPDTTAPAPSRWLSATPAPSRRSSSDRAPGRGRVSRPAPPDTTAPAPSRWLSATPAPSRRSSSDRAPGRGRVSRPAPPDTHTPALDARHLSLAFVSGRDRRPVLDDLSFTLPAGTTLGLVGPSGSGKTTVARIALGLQRPDVGDLLLFGEPWSAASERDRRPRRGVIGAVYQDPLGSFDPRLTVRSLLDDALQIAGVRRSERPSRLLGLLDSVGLAATVADRRPRRLSGGQGQRVAIARALAAEPRVLVLDEPVSSLDVSIQAQILDLLDDLQRDRSLSYLFISHDEDVIAHMSDEVLVLIHAAAR